MVYLLKMVSKGRGKNVPTFLKDAANSHPWRLAGVSWWHKMTRISPIEVEVFTWGWVKMGFFLSLQS